MIIIFSGILLLVTGVSFRLLLFWRSPAALTVSPLLDDPYYTQNYARRISQGHLFSLNGQQKSDAYFPLYTFSSALAHRLAGNDRPLGIKYALGVNFLIFLSCLITVGFVSSRILHWVEPKLRRRLSFLGMAVYASSFIIFNADMNLMETGLQLLISLWILYQTLLIYQKKDKEDRDFAYLSLLFVLVCLTRIDMALFVAGYSLILLFRRQKWGLNKKRLAIITIPPALASAAWITAGYLGTGLLLPTGIASAFVPSWSVFVANANRLIPIFLHFFLGFPHSTTTEPYNELFWDLRWNHHPWFKIAVLAFYLFALLSIIVYFLRGHTTKKEKLKYFFYSLAPFVSGILLLVIFYTICYNRNCFFSRYFIITVPLFLFFWVTVFALLLEPQDSGKGYTKKVAFVILMFFSQFLIFIYTQHNIFQYRNYEYWQMVEWANLSTAPGESIASGETGILGYWRDNVINLDGKTNVDATIALKKGMLTSYAIDIKPTYYICRNVNYQPSNIMIERDPLFGEYYELVQEQPFFIWKRKAD